ncbi:MAG: HEPN domain-containing protein [Clostridia bacterium]|nr:HEPN domain-containing protein [Clostridia bacterium]
MNRLDKYGYWLMLADYDLDTIDALIAGKRWVYVAFLCQQAAERQLKSMYVYYMDAEPPKTHNVNFLFARVIASAGFQAEADQARFMERKEACEDYLSDVMFYYMSDYPFSYKNIKSRFVNEGLALALTEKTRDFVGWLRSFQPPVQVPDIPQ